MKPQQTLWRLQRQLYEESRSTGWPLPQMMTWVLDRRNLEAAWDRVQASDGARTPGLDGQTAAEIRPRLGRWLGQLSDALYRGSYRPTKPRWIDVPKDRGGGETRRLGILTVRDRVVHAALKQVLEPILEPVFHNDSFGFRPGRSVPAALDCATQLLSAPDDGGLPFECALPLDVKDCFDTVDHDLICERLAQCTSDENLLNLVRLVLTAGGTTRKRFWWWHTAGVVQGSALSPLLCNYYLHSLDESLAELGRETSGGVRALRYADDLLVLARGPLLARRAKACTRKALRRLRQRLSGSKSSLQMVCDGVDWLGLRIVPRETRFNGRVEFGYIVPDAKVRKMLDRVTEMTVPPSTRIDPSAFDLGRWFVSINEQLRDWRQVYMYADNAGQVFQALDEHVQARVGELLHSVTGLRRRVLLEQFAKRLPRGFSTWQIDGARLVVLSSLAPRRPRKLIRRPPWMYVPRNGSAARARVKDWV